MVRTAACTGGRNAVSTRHAAADTIMWHPSTLRVLGQGQWGDGHTSYTLAGPDLAEPHVLLLYRTQGRWGLAMLQEGRGEAAGVDPQRRVWTVETNASSYRSW